MEDYICDDRDVLENLNNYDNLRTVFTVLFL